MSIPAAFDITSSTLLMVALTQTAASVYQMMRGSIVLITAILSMIFLKRKQYLHHFVSLCMIVAGVASVGYIGVSKSQSSTSS